MSRRSSRRPPKKVALNLPDNVLRGLSSLVEGNEDLIAKMLSTTKKDDDDAPLLLTALTDCMAMNNLSAEALLARFFDSSVLSVYCIKRIGGSGKGNEATLAARIARAWGKSNFEALPIDDDDDDEKEKKASSSPLNEKEEASPSKKHKKEDKETKDEKDTPKKRKQKK